MLYARELLSLFLPLVLSLRTLAGCRPDGVNLLFVHSTNLYLRAVLLSEAALVEILQSQRLLGVQTVLCCRGIEFLAVGHYRLWKQ